MKHIQKKFQIEFPISESDRESLKLNAQEINVSQIQTAKIPKGSVPLLLTDKGIGITGFRFKSKTGKQYIIPEPDPILIYYDTAYFNFINLKKAQAELFTGLETTLMTEGVTNQVYHYFSLSSSYIILLFTSIEGFINRSIPADFVFEIQTERRRELYSREQIQNHLSFDVKISKVIPQIFGKSFVSAHPVTWTHISNLKALRDKIVHTKDNIAAGELFQHLYKPELNFKYEEVLLAVRDLFNYYRPGYIVDCPCSNPA